MPLRASFQVKLNGESVAIATVGQAYRFITQLNTVEWMEFQALHDDAKAALEAAAENGMMIVQATERFGTFRAREVALTRQRQPSAGATWVSSASMTCAL